MFSVLFCEITSSLQRFFAKSWNDVWHFTENFNNLLGAHTFFPLPVQILLRNAVSENKRKIRETVIAQLKGRKLRREKSGALFKLHRTLKINYRFLHENKENDKHFCQFTIVVEWWNSEASIYNWPSLTILLLNWSKRQRLHIS